MQAAGASRGKRPRELVSNAAVDAVEEGKRIKLDFDILECPICSELFTPPVYQCENGHTVCSSCCKKLTKGCPSCSQPVGRIRNMAIESIIESLEMECKNACHGCKVMVKYSQREEHENDLCEHRLIQCPVLGHHEYYCQKHLMTSHLRSKHNAEIVEFLSSTGRISKSCMEASKEYVMVKFKETWLLLHCRNIKTRIAGAAMFYCSSIGGSKRDDLTKIKEVAYKLKIEQVAQRSVVYSMQAVALHSSCMTNGNFDYLFVPHKGVEKTNKWDYEVTVSLV